ncbi:MAG: VCBS repeat-containing protein [Treponema sp.]|jgi:hypothetical protein|nr:VCBS repeat-containing protein [Treponema sp.]
MADRTHERQKDGGEDKKKKKHPLRAAGIMLLILAGVPLAAGVVLAGLSFIGRIDPYTVLPDSFTLYASIPDPGALGEKVLAHETLPRITAMPELAFLLPGIRTLREQGLTEKPWFRFISRGRLDAAYLPPGRVLAAWDMGVLSSFIRLLPMAAGRITVPGLYYVRAGKNSRFEFRGSGDRTFYIGYYHNLLVVSDDSELFESVLEGRSRDGDRRGPERKAFYSLDYDIAFLLAPEALPLFLGEEEPIKTFLEQIRFPAVIEAGLRITPRQLDMVLNTPISTGNGDLEALIAKNSLAPVVTGFLGEETQYATVLAAGNLRELLRGAGSVSGAEWERNRRRADTSSRTLLGMDLEELLCSWSGGEFAVFGLEGRPNPVIAMEIADEPKRRAVFDRVFKSLVVNEDSRLNLDGNRIPRIRLPAFLNSLLESMDLRIPSPYYLTEQNYLFVSESAETLLAAINSIRRNTSLPKTELWRSLSGEGGDRASFSIFYSLDRSLPFFLRGNTGAAAVLKLYRRGLMRLTLEESTARVYLSVMPGASGGLTALSPFPIEPGGKLGNQVYLYRDGKTGESRILLARENALVGIDPIGGGLREMTGTSPFSLITAGEPVNGEGILWAVNGQGRVVLLNKNMEALRGFPLTTGIRLSAPPGAQGDRLYLCGEDGAVTVVNGRGLVSRWPFPFDAPLRAAPSFLDLGGKSYAAVYPKSFLGELWLLDGAGEPLEGWPVEAGGISFGSPLLCDSGGRLLLGFITQAGEFSLYDESAAMLPGFPLELPGVFYLQPVFDGENFWIIESSGLLFRVGPDGTPADFKIPGLSVKEEGYLAAMDVDGDGRREILITGEGNALFCVTEDFTFLEGSPLPIWGRPAVGDLNGDGKNEITGAGMDNKIYSYTLQ